MFMEKMPSLKPARRGLRQVLRPVNDYVGNPPDELFEYFNAHPQY